MGSGPTTPVGADWAPDSVVYQVFVDRFANGDRRRDPVNVAPWGSPPTRDSVMGGDLAGIGKRLDYLADLGIDAICLTPIFLAASNHRYDTCDYMRIDPRVGTAAGLRRLVRDARALGIRILLDGVFNHCGRGFFPFVDIMENGAASAYRDWFDVQAFPVCAYSQHRYRAWQDVASLPEFDLDHPAARAYLLGVARHWTSLGVSGWRLDAVAHARTTTFWGALRDAVREVDPEAYLVAEIWSDPSPHLAAESFDGATNYRLREALLDLVVRRTLTPPGFAARLSDLTASLPPETTLGMWNLLGSHDTPRIATVTSEKPGRLLLLFSLLFCLPGIPTIYYGDEVGLRGGGEPASRGAMEWRRERWDRPLHVHVKRLVALRRALVSLRRGTIAFATASTQGAAVVFVRRTPGEVALVVANVGERPASVDLDLRAHGVPEGLFVDRLGRARVSVADGHLRLEGLAPTACAVLVADPGGVTRDRGDCAIRGAPQATSRIL